MEEKKMFVIKEVLTVSETRVCLHRIKKKYMAQREEIKKENHTSSNLY